MTTINKFITAAVGAVAMAVSLGLLPDSVSKWVAVAIAFLTAAGVYAVPNKPAAAAYVPPKVVPAATLKKATRVKKAAKKAKDAGQITLLELGALCGIIALILVLLVIFGPIAPAR